MISISKNSNSNYLAKIIKIKTLRKHENADKLQIAIIDFQNVITGLDAKEGDMYVFFPLETQLNSDFLSETNSYRHKELNADKEQVGFFEDNRRVRAIKLRSEKSMGYIVPLKIVEDFTGKELSEFVDKEFDTIGDILMVKKYQIKVRESGQNQKLGKKPRVSRLVDGQVHFHIHTENLRKEAYKIKPSDYISISYKIHGTSGWTSNVLVKRRLNIFTKLLKLTGIKIKETEYDLVFGSRRIAKNRDFKETKHINDFYDGDLWTNVKDKLKEFVPKGFTLYYEIVGFTKSGAYIQQDYDYSCKDNEHKIFIYRITFTNEDGNVFNLTTDQIKEYCNNFGLNYVHEFYTGKAKDLYDIAEDENWTENFIKFLERDYNEKDCFICKNKVPEEGIVLRREKLSEFEAWKLKSFRYLTHETELLDKGQENMEDNQSDDEQ